MAEAAPALMPVVPAGRVFFSPEDTEVGAGKRDPAARLIGVGMLDMIDAHKEGQGEGEVKALFYLYVMYEYSKSTFILF